MPEASQLLKCSSTPVTFDWGDHPSNSAGVSLLSLVIMPTICSIGIGRTPVDGGAGLHLFFTEVFHQMQIGERKLTPSAPFCGMTNGKTLPMG